MNDQRVSRKLFFQLAESLPFELLEEYRQIFSFFDRWSKFELQMMRLAMISLGTNGLIMTNYSMRDPHSSLRVAENTVWKNTVQNLKVLRTSSRDALIRNTHPKR